MRLGSRTQHDNGKYSTTPSGVYSVQCYTKDDALPVVAIERMIEYGVVGTKRKHTFLRRYEYSCQYQPKLIEARPAQLRLGVTPKARSDRSSKQSGPKNSLLA